MTLPTSVHDITSQWLTEALRSGGHDVQVSALDVTPIGVGVGIMSLVFRLTPTYTGPAGPTSLVMKIAPPYEQVRAIAAGYGMYEREVAIYSELGPQLALRPPRLHFGAFDPTTRDFVVVIDDLGHLRSSDQITGCSIDDAHLVIRSLARHHAQWWNDTRLEQLNYIQSPAAPPWPQYNDQSFKAAWPVIVERFGDSVPERIGAICDQWSNYGPVLMEDVVNHPFTLCHGDVRLDNVFFHDDEDGSVSIVDWQIANIGLGTNDVAYFMSQSLTIENRRECEHELLRQYHELLVASGVTDYPFEDLWDDYRRCLTFCLTYPVTAGSGELANERAYDLCRTMLERCVAAIIDTDADQLGPTR